MNVLIVPDSPRENWLSMALYAQEVEACGRRFKRVSARTLRYPASPRLVPARLEAAFDRYVTSSRVTRRCTFDVAHILDHAYAHVLYYLGGRPGVITCHDLTALDLGINSPTVALFRLWGAPALRRAARIVAISYATKTNLMRHLGIDEKLIDVVPHGIDGTFSATRWRAQKGPLKILHVGSNHRHKRVDLAAAATAELSNRGYAVEFWKVGPALEDGVHAALDAAGVTVRTMGALGTRELAEVYASASLLLFPSSHEGWGRPVAEATAVGLPSIISDIPALAEASGGFGTSVAGSDPIRFADACLRAGTMPDDARLQEGRAWATEISWERHGLELERIYEEVAAHP